MRVRIEEQEQEGEAFKNKWEQSQERIGNLVSPFPVTCRTQSGQGSSNSFP